MTMDQYLYRLGKQTHEGPLKAPGDRSIQNSPYQQQRQQRQIRKRRKTVVMVITAPLWVPLLPFYGVFVGGIYVYDKISDVAAEKKRLAAQEARRQEMLANQKVPHVIVHPDGTAVARV